MLFLLIVGALVLGTSTAYVASEDIRYIARAGIEETEILRARRPIAELVKEPGLRPERRRQLELVLEARDHAAALGLEAKETYTAFSDVGRDTLLLVLSAAPRNALAPYTWKYPIVGRMPYKGFFDTQAARKAADRLAAKGYDIYLRPAAAFSTLGWFNDPLLSTALTRDSVELVALVMHEIAHNSLYVKSATPFNESFAQLVGYRAAEDFFRRRGDSTSAAYAANRWKDEIVLARFYEGLVARLKVLYARGLDSAAVDAGRAEAGRWAKAELEGPVAAALTTYRIENVPDRPVNNARLVGATIYRCNLSLFEAWYASRGSDVRRAVAELKDLVRGAEGAEAFRRLRQAVDATAPLPDDPAECTE